MATFGGGLSGSGLTVDTTNLANYSDADGSFNALIVGNNLNIVFTPVLQPASLLAACATLLAGARIWRRRPA